MLKPATRSLRARLTATYVVALTIGLIAFAAFSLTAIDQELRSALDSRLGASSRAFIGSLTVEDGVVDTDRRMRQRLRAILSPQQNAAIVGLDGKVLMQSGAIPPPVVALAKEAPRETVYASVRADGTPLRVVIGAIPGASNAVVVLWRPVDFIGDYRRTGLITFGAAILAIVLGAFWIGSMIARRGLEPLGRVAAVASEIEAHDLSRRLTTPMGDEELTQFCAAFNRMLDRLQFAFEQQRDFSADASHELRAPLAVIRAEADLALRRVRDGESYRESLRSIQAEVLHLESLIDALLTMARAQAGFSAAKDAGVSEIVERAIARMTPFAAGRKIAIRSTIAPQARGIVDAEQFERILFALLHNAIKFGREGGAVDVALLDLGTKLRILVRDDGPGFSEAARSHAFDRFWRDRAGERSSASGLGLAIAKAAIERWGGVITASNAAGGGAQVAITLPAPSDDAGPPLPELAADRSQTSSLAPPDRTGSQREDRPAAGLR